MIKEIKYIGFYDLPMSKIKRVTNIAATNKMDYICDAINRAGFDIHLVSPSWLNNSNDHVKYKSQETIQIDDHKRITFCPSFSTSTKLGLYIKIVFTLIWLFIWLIIHVRKNEKILVYHVQWISLPIRWAKKIKGFKLILEVEEIYSDVSSINHYFEVLENKLIANADSYLFSTELLIDRISTINKPYIVIYGVYSNIPKLSTPPNDGKIHLLYAGIIDTHKSGAFNAIECSRFLSDKYILHIIGFGNTELLIQRIANVNKVSQCKIIFDGSYSGLEFVKYCQSCHIGLNTQSMDGKYLETSFPSKILSYLSLGLRVVSCHVECVTKSQIDRLMTYYYNDTPESIAGAIKTVNLKITDFSKKSIQDLDQIFLSEIKKIIGNE